MWKVQVAVVTRSSPLETKRTLLLIRSEYNVIYLRNLQLQQTVIPAILHAVAYILSILFK
jgi:hypothetical protein